MVSARPAELLDTQHGCGPMRMSALQVGDLEDDQWTVHGHINQLITVLDLVKVGQKL